MTTENKYNTLVDQKLEYWKKKLIDLSKRNNLISYRFTKSKSIQVKFPELSQALDDIYHERNILFLKEGKDKPKEREWIVTEEDKIIEKKLSTLYNKTCENYQELGVNTSFISLGVLKYFEAGSSEIIVEAPIFLFPVEFEKIKLSTQHHQFEINTSSGELHLNPALKEKLFHDFKIEIQDLKQDESPLDYINYLQKKISDMKKWSITNDIYIDIFSYQKYIMYEDLKINKRLVKESSLIQTYIGDKDALQEDIKQFEIENFDDATSIDVLPADSTQKMAIELAKSGVTFVLQGPPGTGKSQTIVNIISALIEQKKKILFVSQKMAALNVVQKRLDEVGLGRYCLNLHTYKSNKKEIVNQLMTELLTSPKIPSTVQNYTFDNYLNTQTEINEFYKRLSEKHQPWNLSIYEIRGELAKLYDIQMLNSSLKNTLKLNNNEFLLLKNKLEKIDSYLILIPNPLIHPFFNYKLDKSTTLTKNKFNLTLNKYNIELEKLKETLKKLEKNTQINIMTFAEIIELTNIEIELHKLGLKNISKWMIAQDFEEKIKLINTIAKLHLELQDLEKKFSQTVEDDFLTSDTKESKQVFLKTLMFNRLFNNEYKKHKLELTEKFAKKDLNHSDWIKLFEEKEKYSKTLLKLEKHFEENKKHTDIIENYNNRKEIFRLNEIMNQLSQIYNLTNKFNDNHNNDTNTDKGYILIEHILDQKDNLNDLTSSIKKYTQELNEYFENDTLFLDKDIENLFNTSSNLIHNFPTLLDITLFKNEFVTMDNEILMFLSEYIESKSKSKFFDSLLKSYYLQMLEQLEKKNISSPKLLALKFNKEDLQVREMKRYKIIENIENRQPKEMYVGSRENETFILKREHEKKRKIKPIRNLLEEIPNLVFTLKPCFMMSPLTVSQYINPKTIHFDVVIFDEASQIMPEDAVPCLIRSKQTIIIGDTQQLPPTSFFLSQDDETDIDEQIEDLDSFLSEASTKFRSKSLNWHYRSKNENLIAFSNKFFYDNRLITFPNSSSNENTGLELIYVKTGIYDRGKSRKNIIEAKQVVEVYKKLKKIHPDKSIGIIAFSLSQENAIKEAFQIEKLLLEETVDNQNEELFIKNLETVQGDERDIIIISIGYAKDSTGKLSYNFGPLNKEGGYKRLNVAITRSRVKTIVISSILPEELEIDKINTEGVKHLKNYLDYAKNKDLSKFQNRSEKIQFDSTFEESVYETLIEEKYQVSKHVGTSEYRIDIAIKHPKKTGAYVLGIECDGSGFEFSRYARDRDKIRVNVLNSLGWNIHKIWSEDWINNREKELEKIKNKIELILEEKNKILNFKNEEFTKMEEIVDFKEVNLKSKYKQYEICELELKKLNIKIDISDNLDKSSKEEIIKRLMKVIITEGPIEKELLFKRVLDSIGILKLEKKIVDLLLIYLEKLENEQEIYIDENSVCENELQLIYPRISTEDQRPFYLIPKEELAGAILDILRINFSSTKDALINDVAKEIYHNKRTGIKIDIKMNEVFDYLFKYNFIEEKNNKIQLKKKI